MRLHVGLVRSGKDSVFVGPVTFLDVAKTAQESVVLLHTLHADEQVMDASLSEGRLDHGFWLALEIKFSNLFVFFSILNRLLFFLILGESLALGNLAGVLFFGFAALFHFEVQVRTSLLLLISIWRSTVTPVSIYIDLTEALQHTTKGLSDKSIEGKSSFLEEARELVDVNNLLKAELSVFVLEDMSHDISLFSEHRAYIAARVLAAGQELAKGLLERSQVEVSRTNFLLLSFDAD